jgi:hypothetical protein
VNTYSTFRIIITEINWVFLAGIVSSVLGFAQFLPSPYAKESVEFDAGGRVGNVPVSSDRRCGNKYIAMKAVTQAEAWFPD